VASCGASPGSVRVLRVVSGVFVLAERVQRRARYGERAASPGGAPTRFVFKRERKGVQKRCGCSTYLASVFSSKRNSVLCKRGSGDRSPYHRPR
jgi:hypothetical protein